MAMNHLKLCSGAGSSAADADTEGRQATRIVFASLLCWCRRGFFRIVTSAVCASCMDQACRACTAEARKRDSGRIERSIRPLTQKS
jgi:hypothetical protein